MDRIGAAIGMLRIRPSRYRNYDRFDDTCAVMPAPLPEYASVTVDTDQVPGRTCAR